MRAQEPRQGRLRHQDSPLAIPAIAVAVVLIASLVTPASTAAVAARLGVLAVALAAFAVIVVRPAVVSVATAVVFLLFEAIATGRHGDFAWHAPTDLISLGGLVAAAACGEAFAVAQRWAARRSTRSSGQSFVDGPVASIPRQLRRGE